MIHEQWYDISEKSMNIPEDNYYGIRREYDGNGLVYITDAFWWKDQPMNCKVIVKKSVSSSSQPNMLE